MDESFAREEIAIPVKCDLHPWMRGYIAVFKHACFAVTGKDGTFDLSSLPPGAYTIKAWHEKLGTSRQTITVVRTKARRSVSFSKECDSSQCFSGILKPLRRWSL
jgi:hypothetical protein